MLCAISGRSQKLFNKGMIIPPGAPEFEEADISQKENEEMQVKI